MPKHVAKTGNNANSGNDLANAWLTCNYAAGNISGSELVYVHVGTYAESLTFLSTVIPSGNAGVYTRFWAWPGDAVSLTPASGINVLRFGASQAYIEFVGITFDGTNITNDVIKIEWFDGNYAHHIRLIDCEVTGSHVDRGGFVQHVLLTAGDNLPATGGNEFINCAVHGFGWESHDQGFYIGSPNNTVEDCDIYDITGGGIEIFNSAEGVTACSGNIMRRNRVHDSAPVFAPPDPGQGRRGINICADACFCYDNLVYRIGSLSQYDNAIWIFAGDDNLIAHNTLFDNDGNGIAVGYQDATTADGTIVTSNIVYQSAGPHGNYWAWNETNTTLTGNLFGTDPQFDNPGADDYEIGTDSAAYQAGTFNATVLLDFNGAAFLNPPSAGAYEALGVGPVWSLIASDTAGAVSLSAAVTGEMDMVGADLFLVNVAWYAGATDVITVSDTSSNTWLPLTKRVNINLIAEQMFYATSPTVTSAQIFTAQSLTDPVYPSIQVLGFSGSAASPFGAQTGNTSGSAVTIQPGAAVPTVPNALIVTGLGFDDNGGDTISIDLGFSEFTSPYAGGVNEGGSLAYLILPTAASKNPTWDVGTTSAAGLATTIVWFRPEATDAVPIYLNHYRRRR